MCRVFDDGGAVGEELQLLRAFGCERGEVLAMLRADIGNHADGWTDNRLQACHLAHLGDTCLKNRQFGLFVQLPNAEWYAYLRVVRFG